MAKNTSTITVNNQPIAVVTDTGRNNYICLTDMIRANEPDAERTGMILQNWMRRKDTIEYIGFWEMLSNPDFNVREFDVIKNNAGTNRFVLTAKDWQEANPESSLRPTANEMMLKQIAFGCARHPVRVTLA